MIEKLLRKLEKVAMLYLRKRKASLILNVDIRNGEITTRLRDRRDNTFAYDSILTGNMVKTKYTGVDNTWM